MQVKCHIITSEQKQVCMYGWLHIKLKPKKRMSKYLIFLISFGVTIGLEAMFFILTYWCFPTLPFLFEATCGLDNKHLLTLL